MASSSDDKMKEEVYQNVGGMNTKADPYSMTSTEFLSLSNFDFQSPGALSQRWGTTLYQSQNFSGPMTALNEFIRLDGVSGLISATANGIWFGATTGVAQGLSLTNTFNPQGLPIYMSVFSAPNATPNSTKETFVNFFYKDIPTISLGGPSLPAFRTQLALNAQRQSGNNLSFSTLQNFSYLMDGNIALKFDGTTTSPIGLPPVAKTAAGTSISWTTGQTLISLSTGTNDASGAGASPYFEYAFYASYVNSRNFEGPIWPIAKVIAGGFQNGTTAASLSGGSYLQVSVQVATPQMYDIQSINIYSYAQPNGSSISMISNVFPTFSKPYRFLSNVSATGSTFVNVSLGATSAGWSNLMTNAGAAPSVTNQNYLPLGMTFQIPNNGLYVSEVDINTFIPRFDEIFQNRLFLAGFSATPSSVWFSDVSEPEGYDPSFNFEVRTNDGDRVTALKSYNSRLYIFKQFSFFELSGDNPDNFFAREVSNQYGCLSNRACAIYNDIMLFLDAKGVMQFNGAGLQCISNKIQPVFDSINLTAAIDQATMVNDKVRNQILIGIPTNGATINNTTVVYDYLMNAWTKYDGYSPSVYTTVKQRFGVKTVLFGGYSGQIMNFGASLMGDNGVGFTCYLKTSFQAQLGQSTEKLYRRTWFNFDEVTGSTVPININYFQDYGASIVLNRTVFLTPFQSRIDFGIPAKSLAFELSKFSASTIIKFHGYSHAYRYQRGV